MTSARRITRGTWAAMLTAGVLFGGVGAALAVTPTTTIGTSITTTGTITGDGSLLTNLSKSQVGLGNVDNLQQMPLSYLDADATFAANSDTKVATQKATKKYVDDADATKADKVSSATAGHFAGLDANGNLTDSSYSFSSFLGSSGDGSSLTGLTKSQVGLGNVPNTDATNPANITQDSTHRFVSDTEKTAWNGKVSKSGDTMTGLLVLSGDPSNALGAATKQYVDSGLSAKLSLSGGTMTGTLAMGGNNISGAGIVTASSFVGGGASLTGLTKSQVGLGNVANVDTTNPANITADSTHRFVTDTQISSWDGSASAVGGKADKVSGATSGNFAALNSSGNLTDSGRAAPTGAIVGTSDAQTLSFKDMIDSSINFVDDGISTRKMQFQLSGITANNTRVLTVPDTSGLLYLVGQPLQTPKILGSDTGTIVRFDTFISGGDYLTVTNADSTAPVTLSADGTDADVSLRMLPKGTGSVFLGGSAVRLPVHSVDPTGSTGMVYFNGVSNALRCYGTAWADCSPSTQSFLSKSGNTFGADISVGTNDAFSLKLVTNGAARLTIDSSGKAEFAGGVLVNGDAAVSGNLLLGPTTHIYVKQSTSPVISDDGDNNSVLQPGSSDVAGALTATATTHTAVTVAFATAYTSVPFCTVSATNSSAAVNPDTTIVATYVTTTLSSMTIHASPADRANGASYAYHCVSSGNGVTVPQ